jgi:hypothetical protein
VLRWSRYFCVVISIGTTLASDEVFSHAFVCDLSKCKGACCVEGDAGAPLREDELAVLDRISTAVAPYLRPEGLAALAEQGNYVRDTDGEWVTPLVHGKECAYVVFEGGTSYCGIERAFRDGVVDWPKPLSCHLYPIRVTSYRAYDALNVDHWKVCEPACSLGQALKVPVFRFLKDPLIRAYGSAWYEEAELVYQALEQERGKA